MSDRPDYDALRRDLADMYDRVCGSVTNRAAIYDRLLAFIDTQEAAEKNTPLPEGDVAEALAFFALGLHHSERWDKHHATITRTLAEKDAAFRAESLAEADEMKRRINAEAALEACEAAHSETLRQFAELLGRIAKLEAVEEAARGDLSTASVKIRIYDALAALDTPEEA